jgi:energy-coupling factor transport system ATP-binding protein
VFQSPPDQLVASVVEEDVAFGLENLGVGRPEMLTRVSAALGDVGLLAERCRPPRFLSAGPQQRLAIAGAIAMRPRAVAFDEATSMIDPLGRASVLELMDRLVSEGIAVIHVTHDMDEAARAGRVAVLDGGRLAFLGSPEELFSSADLEGYRLSRPRSFSAAVALGLAPALGEEAAALGRRAVAELGSEAAERALEAGLITNIERPRGSSSDTAMASGALGSAFSVKRASMSYLQGTEGERLAVDGASIEVPAGSLVAIVGMTGSGKSSLLQLLDALALPSSGAVTSLGVDTSSPKADLRKVRMRAPLAVQRPESAIFEVYAGDEVAFGPRNQGLSGTALIERVKGAMESAGLPFDGYRDSMTRTLSGGRKRRLAIASILALDPEALLLDEPTSALDPASRAEVLALIRSYADKGRTVVMSTHSMEEAAGADLVAVMKGGAIAAYGPPSEVFIDGWDDSWGIGRPFAFELALALGAGRVTA